MAEAWRRFIADGRYRVANPNDFKFSDAANSELRRTRGSDWHRYIERPYMGIDIEYDGGDDFIAIIVDATRNDASRFGIVIFRERKNGKGYEAPYWLYRDRDLSRTILGRASTKMYVEEYRDDGTTDACMVRWNQHQRQYTCD